MLEMHRDGTQYTTIDLFIAINLDLKFIYKMVSLNIKEIY